MKMFMIYNQETGLYSTGGSTPKFVKQPKGKRWKNRGDVIKHLRLGLSDKYFHGRYKNCVIVPFELIETMLVDNRENITDILIDMHNKKIQKEKQQTKSRKQRQIKDLKEKLAVLEGNNK